MVSQKFRDLVDRWMTDAGFRSEIRGDPEGVLRKTGMIFTDEERKAFSAIDWSLPDEHLKTRINKIP